MQKDNFILSAPDGIEVFYRFFMTLQGFPKVYFGKEQLCHLHEEVTRFGKRVLMVYGGGSHQQCGDQRETGLFRSRQQS